MLPKDHPFSLDFYSEEAYWLELTSDERARQVLLSETEHHEPHKHKPTPEGMLGRLLPLIRTARLWASRETKVIREGVGHNIELAQTQGANMTLALENALAIIILEHAFMTSNPKAAVSHMMKDIMSLIVQRVNDPEGTTALMLDNKDGRPAKEMSLLEAERQRNQEGEQLTAAMGAKKSDKGAN